MNRQQIVERHSPIIKEVDSLSPLSLGNGELGFSADITGLQTFPESYETPLSTQSNWGWHYTRGSNHFTEEDIIFQSYDTYGRQADYPMKPAGKEEAYHWLRQNPHRLHLGRISFRFLSKDGKEVNVNQITDIQQKMNLWTGVLHSHFSIDDTPVSVQTTCHPERDVIGVKVSSSLINERRLHVFILFPAPDITHNSWSKATVPSWDNDDSHSTEVLLESINSAVLKRKMDDDSYEVKWNWNAGQFEKAGNHEYSLIPDQNTNDFAFTVSFAQENPPTKKYKEVLEASQKYWESFWIGGAFVSFEGSSDPRAFELERRVIISQYLSAIHSGGSLPPQETGYMYNSWFGKFHLEMHWWHAAHFPIWGRVEKLLKSMDWYSNILPQARKLAYSQGYSGARWPKMVGFDGIQSPSPVAPGLIWQQPHPIALAELCYKANPSKEILDRFSSIVFESADFMVSYAHLDVEKDAFVLGPPLIPAQECHKINESINPPYELEYWKYGLEIAINWAKRMGVPINSKWSKVATNMAKLPQKGGVYLAHEDCPNTFTEKNHDHPSMLGALGILPGTLVDPEIMRNTLKKVKEEWQWETAWGWDFPMCAMTAARLGERKMAVDFLMMDATKNTYLVNGHNYQREGLTAYLPGNGGLLTAVAMMACGWSGRTGKHAPGFPQDGTWSVKWEGLQPIL